MNRQVVPEETDEGMQGEWWKNHRGKRVYAQAPKGRAQNGRRGEGLLVVWRAASRGGGGSVHGRRRPSSWLPSRRVTDLPGAPLCIPPTAVRTASRLLLWQSHYVTSGVRVVTFHEVHILISRRTISACLSRLPQHALLPTPLPQRSPRGPLPLQSFTPLSFPTVSLSPLTTTPPCCRAGYCTVHSAPCGWLVRHHVVGFRGSRRLGPRASRTIPMRSAPCCGIHVKRCSSAESCRRRDQR